MKILKFLMIILFALSMVTACSGDDMSGQETDNSEERDLLKSKLTGEWVIPDQENRYVYAFADNDTVYIKTREGDTTDQWPYQIIAADSIRIIRNWTTHNKVVFYSDDSIRISEFLPGIAAVYPPMFGDVVLKRWLNDEDILPACTARTDDVIHYYITDQKTTILKELPPSQSVSSCIVIAKWYDDTEPTAYLVSGFTTYRICNYPQYAKEWDIPENGLPVLLSGKVYPASFNPGFHPANRAFFDLELTALKSE